MTNDPLTTTTFLPCRYERCLKSGMRPRMTYKSKANGGGSSGLSASSRGESTTVPASSSPSSTRGQQPVHRAKHDDSGIVVIDVDDDEEDEEPAITDPMKLPENSEPRARFFQTPFPFSHPTTAASSPPREATPRQREKQSRQHQQSAPPSFQVSRLVMNFQMLN